MARKNIEFPRYINNYRLYFIFELDELFVLLGVLILCMVLFVLFPIPIYVLLVVMPLSTYYAFAFYKKLVKDAPPGYLLHYFYDLGFVSRKKNNSTKNKHKDIDIPYGFEKEFID